MTDFLYARWLRPRDAGAVARIERKVYARNSRSGAKDIRYDLSRAEREGGNLSLGLYDGTRLLAYMLAYVRFDRAASFEEFDVEPAAAADLDGASIYVEDAVVLPSHGQEFGVLFTKWARQLERLHPDLPLDAFVRPAMLARWRRFARGWRHFGFEIQEPVKVHDPVRGEDWFWLTLARKSPYHRPTPTGDRPPGTRIAEVPLPPGVEARLVETETDWQRLRPDWERLAARTPDTGPFSSFDLSYVWWRHFGLSNRLQIVVLYRDGEVIGILPLMIEPQTKLGRVLRSLRFIGSVALSERPAPIADPEHADAHDLLWRAVAALRPYWDAALLFEQPPAAHEHPLIRALEPRNFLIRQSSLHQAPHVTLSGPWDDYLAGRSSTLRKSYRRKLRRLEEAGRVRLVSETSFTGAAERLMETYLGVERRSWKHVARQGVASRAGHAAYYRELCDVFGPREQAHFRFLYLDDRPIAATFGLLLNGRYVSLEICHDEAFDRYSPGVLLTALELEELHGRSDCRDYDFLTGTLDNKTTWATGVRTTRDLYLLPNDHRGRLDALLSFRLKPALKRWLQKVKLEEPVTDAVRRLRKLRGG